MAGIESTSEVNQLLEAEVPRLMDYLGRIQNARPSNGYPGATGHLFDDDGASIRDLMDQACALTLTQISDKGVEAYRLMGGNTTDLRLDTSDQLGLRSDCLAVVSAPEKTPSRQRRAGDIQTFLQKIIAGETIELPGFTEYTRHFSARTVKPQKVSFNPKLPIMGELTEPGFGYFGGSTLLQIVQFNPEQTRRNPKIIKRLAVGMRSLSRGESWLYE